VNSVQQHCTSGNFFVTRSAAVIAVLDLGALRVLRRASHSPKVEVYGSFSCALRKTKGSGAATKGERGVMPAAETTVVLFAAESLCLLLSFGAATVPAMLAFVASAPVTLTHLPWR